MLMVLGYACATTFGRSGGRRDRFAKRKMEAKQTKYFKSDEKRHEISEKKIIRDHENRCREEPAEIKVPLVTI